MPRSNLFVVFNACSNRLRRPPYASEPRPEFLAARHDALPLHRRVGPLRA